MAEESSPRHRDSKSHKDKESKQKDKSTKDGGKSDKLERKSTAGKISLVEDVDTVDADIIDQLKLQRRGPSAFEKIKLIGKGGVGRVYLVRLRDTEQLFAMKVLKKTEMIQRNKVFLSSIIDFPSDFLPDIFTYCIRTFPVGLHTLFEAWKLQRSRFWGTGSTFSRVSFIPFSSPSRPDSA
jgi:hypothetical protein